MGALAQLLSFFIVIFAAGIASGEVIYKLDSGDKLFQLQPEIRNLETVFAEVNASSDTNRNTNPNSNEVSV